VIPNIIYNFAGMNKLMSFDEKVNISNAISALAYLSRTIDKEANLKHLSSLLFGV
jgi:hypothetical protein